MTFSTVPSPVRGRGKMYGRRDSDEVRVIVFMSVCVLTSYAAADWECDCNVVCRLGLGGVWFSLCGEGRVN